VNWRCRASFFGSSTLLSRFGVIAFEKLNVKGMVNNPCLAN